MSTPKQLAEVMLRVLHVVRELPLHEQAGVLNMSTVQLQMMARNAELGQANGPAAAPVVADEHYRQ